VPASGRRKPCRLTPRRCVWVCRWRSRSMITARGRASPLVRRLTNPGPRSRAPGCDATCSICSVHLCTSGESVPAEGADRWGRAPRSAVGCARAGPAGWQARTVAGHTDRTGVGQMGLVARVRRGWVTRERARADRERHRADLEYLLRWGGAHTGVEVFVEPQTMINELSEIGRAHV